MRRDNIKPNSIYWINCFVGLRKLEENSIDSIVTDPPYNLKFMGKKWDDKGTPKEFQKWNEKWAKQAYKVLKPGGYMIVFSGTKTYHRMVSGVEDAGFEIKDMIEWMYGTGFPKSYNISKGFDKQAGAEREVIGTYTAPDGKKRWGGVGFHGGVGEYTQTDRGQTPVTKPSTDKAKKWEGWGTALKPAHEPILLAQKPREGTYCENIDKWGVGGINIEATRVDLNGEKLTFEHTEKTSRSSGIQGNTSDARAGETWENNKGRFPANLLLTHHPDCDYNGKKKVKGSHDTTGVWGTNKNGSTFQGYGTQGQKHEGYADKNGMETVSDWDCHPSCPVRRMNKQSGVSGASYREGDRASKQDGIVPWNKGRESGRSVKNAGYTDKGGAARYFNQFHFVDEDFFKYTAKASKSERTCDGNVDNDHPTVKPIELMKWLVRLVTPPEGLVVDPFCGSGTTCISAYEEGFDYIGMDNDKHSVEIARERMKYHKNEPSQLKLF